MRASRQFASALSATGLLVLGAALNLQAERRTNSRAPQHSSSASRAASRPNQNMPQTKPETMNGGNTPAERQAVLAMSSGPLPHGHFHPGLHMYMTKLRPSNPADWAKADKLAKEIREAILPFKDYHRALADGYRIFLPNVPQHMYHFTNYWNAFLESFRFDPTRPTSLLYVKTKTGYTLIGAMYTMPKRVSLDHLNQRIPLSVARWHLHTNLCLPPGGIRGHVDWTRFGLEGSIATKQACTRAGGTFYPVIFGWMVHVYPLGKTREEIWGQ